MKATTASLATLLEPLVAAVLAWVLFDEGLRAVSSAGAALLIGALLLLTVATARAGEAAPAAASAD